LSGLDFQRELAARNIPIPIIFITGHGDIPMSVHAMKAGAVEFLTKPFRDQDLHDAIRVALERDRAGREQEREIRELEQRFQSLTRREQEVVSMVVSGMLNKQIAGPTRNCGKYREGSSQPRNGEDARAIYCRSGTNDREAKRPVGKGFVNEGINQRKQRHY
jgi:ActR/RegA family two-component response regulator